MKHILYLLSIFILLISPALSMHYNDLYEYQEEEQSSILNSTKEKELENIIEKMELKSVKKATYYVHYPSLLCS